MYKFGQFGSIDTYFTFLDDCDLFTIEVDREAECNRCRKDKHSSYKWTSKSLSTVISINYPYAILIWKELLNIN